MLNSLKQQPLSKNNLIISSDNNDKFLNYINDIQKNNKNMKSIKDIYISLKDIKQDLKDNHKMFNKNDKNKDVDFELKTILVSNFSV